MSPTLAVVIPSLDEEARIGRAIASARAAGADEIVVSDGGSSDRTVEIAKELGAKVVAGDACRGRQLNAGAAATNSEMILFLHADTELPENAKELVDRALQHANFGGFAVSFVEKSARLRFVAAMINLRTRLTKCPWGDQAQFVRRTAFEESGGYHEIPLMEDYEFAIRMKRRGSTVVVPAKVRTSGRRFLERGLVATAFINWRIVAMFRLGADPAKLREIYRRS